MIMFLHHAFLFIILHVISVIGRKSIWETNIPEMLVAVVFIL